jgi:hypothetical protein
LHNYTTLNEQVNYLKVMNCTYIMYYVEWFQGLRFTIIAQGGFITELYRAHLDDNVVCGTDNMAVYQITW